LPAVITTDLRLNEPRYAALPNLMKAKTQPVDETTPVEFGVDVTPRLDVIKTADPPGGTAGVKLESAAELVEKLKEAGVL
jgi:electron transfer flavoprotein beta subunit